jgi:hypothetical protein
MGHSGMFASFDGSPVKLLGRSGTVRAGVANFSRTSPSPMRADTSTGTPDWEARQGPCLRARTESPRRTASPGRVGRGRLVGLEPSHIRQDEAPMAAARAPR